MVEYDPKFEASYKQHRPKSNHIIADAVNIDYKSVFENHNYPKNMDYLQIDLDVDNNSTLYTLKNFDSNIFDTYKFATVTFEHDIYRGDYFNTRQVSREIFAKRGYVRVFGDVSHSGNSFEDWYVHPDLVDMTYVNIIKREGPIEYTEILKLF